MCMSHDQPKSPNSLNHSWHLTTTPTQVKQNKIPTILFAGPPLSLSLSLSFSLHHHLSPPSFFGSDTSIRLAQLSKNTPFSLHLVLNLLQKWENKKIFFLVVIDPWFNWKVYVEFVGGFRCKYLIWIKFCV